MIKEQRMIDANELLENSDVFTMHTKEYGSIEVIPVDAIGDAPTVYAAPVVHGRWHIDKSFVPFICICLECGAIYDVDGACEWNYCPNCGAKMDGGNEDVNL